MALTTVPASLSATALTLTTAAQPNITSVGTLTGLTVSGNIAGTLTTAAQTNITSLGTLSAISVTGTSTLGVVDASSFTDVITNTIYTQSSSLDIDTVLTGRDVTFTQGSTNLMTVKGDASGVGIGESSPGATLHVKGSSGNIYGRVERASASQGEVGFWVRGGTAADYNWYIYQKNNGSALNFYNQSDRLTILSSGKIGIGTSNPNTSLQITEANNGYGSGILLNNSDTNSTTEASAFYHDNSGYTTTWIENRYNNTSATIKFQLRAANAPIVPLTLQGDGAAIFNNFVYLNYIRGVSDSNTGLNLPGSDELQLQTAGSTRLEIDNLGRVGINRNPSITNSKLEVGGADNVPLINVEASGATAGIGIGGDAMQFLYGTTKMATFSMGNSNKYNSGNSPGFGGSGANLRLEGDDSQIIMANNFIHSDNSGYTQFTIRAAYGAVDNRAKLSLDGGHIDFRTGTSFSKRMEIAGGGGIGLDVPASIRTDMTFSAASGHATKRWGFGAGRQASSAPFYTINENNTGVYVGYGNQSWSAHSDERIKENITSVGTVLPSLMNMQCVRYNLKTDPGNTKIGFIAQDWEANFPEVVDEQSDMVLESDGSIGMAHSSESTTIVKGLSYTETIPLLLKAIQEQQELIETLQTKVAALEAK